MKKTIITMLIALVAMVASADTYSYLKFTRTDGSTVTYSVEGIKLTYDDTNVTITNVDGTASLPLAQVQNMEFTNDAGSSTTVIRGDVNGDGSVNISDVSRLINYLQGGDVEIVQAAANCNGDNDVNISDVTMLINFILNNVW